MFPTLEYSIIDGFMCGCVYHQFTFFFFLLTRRYIAIFKNTTPWGQQMYSVAYKHPRQESEKSLVSVCAHTEGSCRLTLVQKWLCTVRQKYILHTDAQTLNRKGIKEIVNTVWLQKKKTLKRKKMNVLISRLHT